MQDWMRWEKRGGSTHIRGWNLSKACFVSPLEQRSVNSKVKLGADSQAAFAERKRKEEEKRK